MELGVAIAHATVQGAASVLPASPGGHRVALQIWLEGDGQLQAVLAMGAVATGLAIVAATRQRLGRAMAVGIRGIARPAVLQESEAGRDAIAIALGAAVAAIIGQLLTPMMAHNQVPIVAAAGFLATALGLVSTAWAPDAERGAPSAGGAIWAGLAHGLAVVPGLSPTGAAFVVLRWCGVRRWAAAEFSLLITAPVAILGGSRGLLDERGALPGAHLLVAAAVVAFLTASVAVAIWRALTERQATAFVGVWLATLALATIGYDHALPAPAEALPLEDVSEGEATSEAGAKADGIRTDRPAFVLGSAR